MKISKFLKRAYRFILKPDTIYFLKRNIIRTEEQIEDIENAFDPKKDCCTTCMSGGEDIRLYKKLHRQIVWLRVLLNKKGKLKEVKYLEKIYGKQKIDFWQKINE